MARLLNQAGSATLRLSIAAFLAGRRAPARGLAGILRRVFVPQSLASSGQPVPGFAKVRGWEELYRDLPNAFAGEEQRQILVFLFPDNGDLFDELVVLSLEGDVAQSSVFSMPVNSSTSTRSLTFPCCRIESTIFFRAAVNSACASRPVIRKVRTPFDRPIYSALMVFQREMFMDEPMAGSDARSSITASGGWRLAQRDGKRFGIGDDDRVAQAKFLEVVNVLGPDGAGIPQRAFERHRLGREIEAHDRGHNFEGAQAQGRRRAALRGAVRAREDRQGILFFLRRRAQFARRA